ncbi:GntR family transcriptional regulator [Subtercola boreus]|uniref:GntR family transcriptional regulator n=1 Tax=Subtercola boreus TaxID=120213 RepID=A0A3E0WAH5_9MICO|nr:GntR family transcriptional regulator [Subtercola boreus]RFA19099.1 GntR family transcriptional regulator [Subtercola boreus]RFA19237.1 GntR family transcriptional regulator [Subtercola boreus]RFA25699.1 GntR family transcriptional regulator [Subtercola boreus]
MAASTPSAQNPGLDLHINPSAPEAPYEQVRLQVVEAVLAGILVPGTKLPTVRALADQLAVATNTVARSYRELERDEVIETRGRNGSFIAASGDGRTRQGHAAALAFVERVRQLQLGDDEALELVRSALRA